MEIVLLTLENGVTIKFSGTISSVSFHAEQKAIELHTMWLHELNVEAMDKDKKPVRWTYYNQSTRPGVAYIDSVIRCTCA